ncbi:hypothetical protein HanLR1_Chr01g0023731 [Helianthus annuus]|nr:hypothetical protein HanHA89_Chr01g0025171 [Helianthus annuus]KAJ0783727.1 hypothetical protein HanLR1_Chr01g0023731 [Helianthus annuus]
MKLVGLTPPDAGGKTVNWWLYRIIIWMFFVDFLTFFDLRLYRFEFDHSFSKPISCLFSSEVCLFWLAS